MNDILYSISKRIPGRRIILRSPEEGDGAMVYEAVVESLDDLRRWPASLPWAVEEPTLDTSEIFCRKSQAELIERKRLPYLVLDAATHSFIGCMGVNRIDWKIPRFEIGFWCRSSCQRTGYMTDALVTLIEFLRGSFKARRIECMTDLENLRARALCERSGMTHEATIHNDRITPAGQLRHSVVYSIIADTEQDIRHPA